MPHGYISINGGREEGGEGKGEVERMSKSLLASNLSLNLDVVVDSLINKFQMLRNEIYNEAELDHQIIIRHQYQSINISITHYHTPQDTSMRSIR